MGGASVNLTPRLREILELLSHGKSQKEIAEELHLSPATVRNYTMRLYDRLGAQNANEAIGIGFRKRYIT